MTYKETARQIYDIIGPANNIINPYHCMTRLRFTVTNEAFTKESLESLEDVKGVHISGEEWQIILGPGKAAKVTEALKEIIKNEETKLSSSPYQITSGDDLHARIRRKNTTPFKEGLRKISRIFTPLIPAFIACGLLTGILNGIAKIDPNLADTAWFQLASVAGNTAFWGLNIFVGLSASKEFEGTPIIGGILAAFMMHPALSKIMLFDAPLTPGRGGIIAVILICFIAAKTEKKLHHLIPDMFDLFLTPLVTFLIASALAILICQPVGGFISETIGVLATTAIDKGGALTGFVLAGTFLPLVLLGVHQGLTPIHAELLSRYGVTVLLPILAMAGAGQVGASIAVYAKTKNNHLKKTIVSALPVGILGIGEPLIYGVTLPLGKPFICACLGGACGGAVIAFFGIGAAAFGISGLPLAAATTRPLYYLLGLITAYTVGFFLTYIIGFADPQESCEEV